MAAAEEPEVRLSLKPKVCILRGDESACNDTLAIAWQADQVLSLCLFQQQQHSPLACWNNAVKGSHALTLKTSRNIEFNLKPQDQSATLATSTFEVIKDHSEYRRARRNAWAFF